MSNRLEEPGKILFHLNGGYTKIILERTIGVGLADGGIAWDIPTEKIPIHLRNIGTRFLIIEPENSDEIEIKELFEPEH